MVLIIFGTYSDTTIDYYRLLQTTTDYYRLLQTTTETTDSSLILNDPLLQILYYLLSNLLHCPHEEITYVHDRTSVHAGKLEWLKR